MTTDPTAFARLRFLEIGWVPVIKSALPDQTEFFNSSPRRDPSDPDDAIGLRRLVERLRSDAVDLVICHAPRFPFWHHQSIVRFLFNRKLFTTRASPLRPLAVPALRVLGDLPVAVIDTEDHPYIDRWNFGLIDRSTLYFKRELPADDWRVFTKTGAGDQPSARFRRKPRFVDRIAKLRPLPLGMPRVNERMLPDLNASKEVDVFFAGNVQGMPVRERGVAELRALAAEGYRVDIPDGRMPRDEFLARCARAWLIWSPEGYGWDCFRHYEAAACGSVPVHNYPFIRRHQPTRQGEHVFFHGPEPGDLSRCIRDALVDKTRLAAMSAAARAHYFAHHTGGAIAHYVIRSTLDAAGRALEPAGGSANSL